MADKMRNQIKGETQLITQYPEHDLRLLYNKCPVYTICITFINFFSDTVIILIKFHSSILCSI
jgi:hypothetical protein